MQIWIRGIILAAALAWPSGAVFAAAFEGVVHFKSSTQEGYGSEFDYFIKGEKARMETQGDRHGKAAIILDLPAKKVVMLMAQQKMAMEMPMGDPAVEKAKDKGELVRTGKTQTLLGYTAEQLLYKSDEGETEIWGAKGLGYFGGMHGRPGTGTDGSPGWTRGLKEQGLFPLLVINKGKDGKEVGRLEATKVEKKSLSDDLFTVPPDYKKFDRDSMTRGMGGGMRRGE